MVCVNDQDYEALLSKRVTYTLIGKMTGIKKKGKGFSEKGDSTFLGAKRVLSLCETISSAVFSTSTHSLHDNKHRGELFIMYLRFLFFIFFFTFTSFCCNGV